MCTKPNIAVRVGINTPLTELVVVALGNVKSPCIENIDSLAFGQLCVSFLWIVVVKFESTTKEGLYNSYPAVGLPLLLAKSPTAKKKQAACITAARMAPIAIESIVFLRSFFSFLWRLFPFLHPVCTTCIYTHIAKSVAIVYFV